MIISVAERLAEELNYQCGHKRTERERALEVSDTIKYKVVRTSEEPVELINGTQTGVYDVEFWQFNDCAKKFFFTRTVQSDLTFEEATGLKRIHSIPRTHQASLSYPHPPVT
jgi:hypothetical protein